MRTIALLSFLLAGCGPPADNACPGAPDTADIDDVEIVASVDPPMFVGDGDIVSYLVGFQGSPMATFDIGYHGGAPDCLRREIRVDDADGNRIFGWTGGVVTLPTSDPMWRTEVVQVVEPPEGDLTVSIDAYGQTMTRTVVPTSVAYLATFTGPASASVGEPMELTIAFSGPSTRYQQLMVTIGQGAAMIDPPSLYLPYGEQELTVRVTPTATGTLVLNAQVWPPDFDNGGPVPYTVTVF